MAQQDQDDPVFGAIDRAFGSTSTGTAVADKDEEDPVFSAIDEAFGKQPQAKSTQDPNKPLVGGLPSAPETDWEKEQEEAITPEAQARLRAGKGTIEDIEGSSADEDVTSMPDTRKDFPVAPLEGVRPGMVPSMPSRTALPQGPPDLGPPATGIEHQRQLARESSQRRATVQREIDARAARAAHPIASAFTGPGTFAGTPESAGAGAINAAPFISTQAAREAIQGSVPPNAPPAVRGGAAITEGALAGLEGLLTPKNIEVVGALEAAGGMVGAFSTKYKQMVAAANGFLDAGEYEKAADLMDSAGKIAKANNVLKAVDVTSRAAFNAQLVDGLYKDSSKFKKAVDAGDWDQASEIIGEAIPNVVFTGLAVRDAAEAVGRVKAGIQERGEVRRTARADSGLPGEAIPPKPQVVPEEEIPENLKQATPQQAAGVPETPPGEAPEAQEEPVEAPKPKRTKKAAAPAVVPEEPPVQAPTAERRVTAGHAPGGVERRSVKEIQGPPSSAVLDDAKARLQEPDLEPEEREALEARVESLQEHPEDVEALKGADLGRIREEGKAPAVDDEVTREITAAFKPEPVLPRDLAGSKPRYGYQQNNYALDFESPTDKALYTVAQPIKNKAHDRFMGFLKQQFPDKSDNEIVAMGQKVRAAIKPLAAADGGESETLTVPKQSFGAKITPEAPVRKFGSTQINLDKEDADEVRGIHVDEDDLSEEGREEKPHVTALFGLHDQPVEDINAVAKETGGPIEATLGDYEAFPEGKDGVPLVIRVESEGLHDLHDRLAELPHTDTHPEYKPHITVGYLKPGAAGKYIEEGNPLKGKKITLSNLVHSSKEKEVTPLELGEKKSGKPAKSIGRQETAAQAKEEARCFPYETTVLTEKGLVSIGEIVEKKMRLGVLSFNTALERLEWKAISGWHVNDRKYSLVKLTHSKGSLVCTSNHSIWSRFRIGYVEADKLDRSHDLLYYETLSPVSKVDDVQKLGTKESAGEEVLLKAMQCGVARETARADRNIQSASGGTSERLRSKGEHLTFAEDAETQSDAQSGDSREDEKVPVGTNVSISRRKRSAYQASDPSIGGVAVADRISDQYPHGEEQISVAAELLQSGHCRSDQSGGDRDRRPQSQLEAVEVPRSPKDGGLKVSWVVSVAPVESGSNGGPSIGGSEGERVYCIEVADNHNFFAEGVLVSNSRNPAEIEPFQKQLAQLYVNRIKKNPVRRGYAQDYLSSRLRGENAPDLRGLPTEDARSVRSSVDSLLKSEKGIAPEKLFKPETIEMAKSMVNEAADLLGQMQKPGRYLADMGDETSLTGQGAKLPVTPVQSMRTMFPWFESMRESPKQLIDAVKSGKGKTYDRLVQAAADYWDRRQAEAKPILDEFGPRAKELAESVREIDPELAARVDGIAKGQFPTYDSLAQFSRKVEDDLNDARAAARFSDAVTELAEHEARESNPEGESLQEGSQAISSIGNEGRNREEEQRSLENDVVAALRDQGFKKAESEKAVSTAQQSAKVSDFDSLFRESLQKLRPTPRQPALLRKDIPERNSARNLSNYVDRVFHESDAASALAFIEPGEKVPDQVHLSTHEGLAKTSESDGGVLLGFDPSKLKGKIGQQKDWESKWKDGEATFSGVDNDKGAWNQGLESITIKPQTKMKQGVRNRMAKALRVLQSSGWDKEEDDDGSVTWSRPESPTGMSLQRPDINSLIPGTEVYRVEKSESGQPVYTRGIVEEGEKVRLQDKISGANTSSVDKIAVPLDERWQVKSPSEEPPANYGESNVLVDKESYEDARTDLMKRSGQLSAGVDPTGFRDLVKIGVYHLEAGARQFGDWSRAIVRDVGGWVRDSLRDAWNEARARFYAPEEKGAQTKEKIPPVSGSRGTETRRKREVAAETPEAQEAAPEDGGIPEGPPGEEPRSKAAQPGEKAGNIRLDKLDSPDEVIDLIRRTAKTNKGRIEYQKRGRLSDAAIDKRMEQVGLDPEKLAKLPRGTALNEAEMRVAIGIMQSVGEKAEAAAREVEKSNSSENILKHQLLANQYVAIHAAVSGVKAESGRALRIQRMISQALDRGSKPGYEKVLDQLGGRKLREEEARKLLEIAPEDRAGYYGFLRDHWKFTTPQMMMTYWKTNLLSSPRTFVRKALGDAVMTALQLTKIGIRPAIDPLMAKMTRRPVEYHAQDALAQYAGYGAGLWDGAKKAAYIMRNGFDEEDVSDMNLPRYQLPGGMVTNFPTRLLGATTRFFQTIHYTSVLAGLASRNALRTGARGEAAKKLAAELYKNPTFEMVEEAHEESQRLALIAKPGKFLRNVNRLVQTQIPEDVPIIGGVAPLEFVAPFRNVAFNLAKEAVNWSPAGAGRVFEKEAFKNPNSKLRSPKGTDYLTEALIGSAILMAIVEYAAHGGVTGTAPKEQSKRDAFYRAGKQPFSIKIGKHWLGYPGTVALLTPALSASAAWWDSYVEKRKTPSGAQIGEVASLIGKMKAAAEAVPSVIESVPSGIAAAAKEEPLLRGVENLFEAITNPDGNTAKEMIAEGASGFVPASSLLRTVAQSLDSAIRQPETIYERIKSGLPILSKKLPQGVDNLGRGETRRGGEGAKAFLPSAIPEAGPQSAVDEELARLQDKGLRGIGEAGQTITMRDSAGNSETKRLDSTERREYQQLRGHAIDVTLQSVFADPDYKSMSDPDKIKAVTSVIRDVEDAAKEEMTKRLLSEQKNALPMEP